MRKPDAALARIAALTERRDRASRQLVCLALVLALAVLFGRIVSMW